MDIKLYKNPNRKLPKTPKSGDVSVKGAAIDCIINGEQSVLHVTFNMYFARKATVLMRVHVSNTEGHLLESQMYGATAGGYGWNMIAGACNDVFSKVFYDISQEDAGRILTELANKISTGERFIIFDEYGVFVRKCKAGAEKVDLV